jgi:hypothetical protein
MPLYRALFMSRDTTAPGDVCTNTLYFEDAGATTDPNNLATDLVVLMGAQTEFHHGANELEARFYDMDDPEPRPVKGQHKATITKVTGAPREVALCLSFYSQRNIPRQRGRIYLGPLSASLGDRPTIAWQNAALLLAAGFADLGGTDVDWCVYSPTSHGVSQDSAGDFAMRVSDVWCDDEWDTVRSRGRKATSRVLAGSSGLSFTQLLEQQDVIRQALRDEVGSDAVEPPV